MKLLDYCAVADHNLLFRKCTHTKNQKSVNRKRDKRRTKEDIELSPIL